MDTFKEEQFSSAHLGHLGLVADKIDSLNLIDLIDARLPISEAHGAKISHGERVAAMIMNGLGFIDSRLYLFPEFLNDKPLDRLFNRNVEAQWFNDDASGRCLDVIAAYGSTKLLTELSITIGQARGLLGKSAHIDTTKYLIKYYLVFSFHISQPSIRVRLECFKILALKHFNKI